MWTPSAIFFSLSPCSPSSWVCTILLSFLTSLHVSFPHTPIAPNLAPLPPSPEFASVYVGPPDFLFCHEGNDG